MRAISALAAQTFPRGRHRLHLAMVLHSAAAVLLQAPAAVLAVVVAVALLLQKRLLSKRLASATAA